MKNSVSQPGQNVAGMYRCTDGWIRLGPSTAKLANWPSRTNGDQKISSKSIAVMNAAVKTGRLK